MNEPLASPSEGWGASPYGGSRGKVHFFRLKVSPGDDLRLESACGKAVIRPREVVKRDGSLCGLCVRKELMLSAK